jgi:hypothetical protein
VTTASIRKKKSTKDKETIYRKLTTIVIDKVSVVRDCCTYEITIREIDHADP